MAHTSNQSLRAEQEELKASSAMWRRKVGDLERTLALKEEELINAVEKRRMRTVTHVETLAELDSTQAELKESQVKCAALEESLQKMLKDKEESHQKDVKEKQETVKQMEEEYKREQKKRQQNYEEELQKKEEAMRREL